MSNKFPIEIPIGGRLEVDANGATLIDKFGGKEKVVMDNETINAVNATEALRDTLNQLATNDGTPIEGMREPVTFDDTFIRRVMHGNPDTKFADMLMKNLQSNPVEPSDIPVDNPEPYVQGKYFAVYDTQDTCWYIYRSTTAEANEWIATVATADVAVMIVDMLGEPKTTRDVSDKPKENFSA